MENKRLVGIKSSYPDLSNRENNKVLRENQRKSSDDECEKNKLLENITAIESNIKFETPGEYLMNKIIQQVEFLFSNDNILKDKFLLKHMRRNKEGYVSLKLISSLRKVKALSKDWRVVAYSLQKSKKLQLNNELTKIKRVDALPLPEVLDASRTVLVFNNNQQAGWTSEILKKQLKRFGTVSFLVIVKSKSDAMNENIKKTFALHEKIASVPFAVVNFETAVESATAVRQTSHPASHLKVVPLKEDENEVSKITNPSPNQGKRSSVTSNRKEIHYIEKFEEKPIKSLLPCAGDGPGNSSWLERKNRITKSKLENFTTPFMAIMRLPKGPDETSGFKERKTSFRKQQLH